MSRGLFPAYDSCEPVATPGLCIVGWLCPNAGVVGVMDELGAENGDGEPNGGGAGVDDMLLLPKMDCCCVPGGFIGEDPNGVCCEGWLALPKGDGPDDIENGEGAAGAGPMADDMVAGAGAKDGALPDGAAEEEESKGFSVLYFVASF